MRKVDQLIEDQKAHGWNISARRAALRQRQKDTLAAFKERAKERQDAIKKRDAERRNVKTSVKKQNRNVRQELLNVTELGKKLKENYNNKKTGMVTKYP